MTEKKREVKKHHLPKGYKSPFDNVLSQWLTYGGTLPKGEVMHKFEMQIAIPGATEGKLGAYYGLKVDDFLMRGAQKLGTEVDDAFKKTLFIGVDRPNDAGKVTPTNHTNAQRQLDKWVYSPRVGKGKTTAVSAVVASLVEAGVLPDAAIETITTNDELQKAIAGATKK